MPAATGAVHTPAVVILPPVAAQVTAVLVVPATETTKVWVAPWLIVAVLGLTERVTAADK
jgi:mRNA-degrading endonuclease toxin of MazEF toxin-antitoxin module